MVERALNRWQRAGLLDADTVARIIAWETAHAGGRLGWPVMLALALGALTVGAGILLFVAAHWDALSPGARFALVLTLVAGFHLGGAASAARFPALSTALHGLGTAALGAGIFLAAQIFHLQEHWPGGVLLWALGAWAGWFLLRDWVQAEWAALLTPVWLVGEWIVATGSAAGAGSVAAAGVFTLAVAYLGARRRDDRSWVRAALMAVGAVALIPATIALYFSIEHRYGVPMTALQYGLGWTIALGAPVTLACLLRGRAAWPVAVGAMWAAFAVWVAWPPLLAYLWCALAAVALIGWGVLEARRERVNLGIAGFAMTVLAFYFSSVADKLGRAASLIVIGVLLLLGGYLLERLRRRLVARMAAG